MDFSTFFAQLYGCFYLIFGFLFLYAGQLGKTIEMTEDKAFVIATGYTSFFLGLVTVILHNHWVLDWTVVVTLLGWATLIKGIRKIATPEKIHQQAQAFKKRQTLSAVFMMVLGAWLLWVGLL